MAWQSVQDVPHTQHTEVEEQLDAPLTARSEVPPLTARSEVRPTYLQPSFKSNNYRTPLPRLQSEEITQVSGVSDLSDATSTASSRVASKLRETVNDWGFTDPSVIANFEKRQRRMGKQHRAAQKR